MLKILQARLQQYMNHELPDVQAGFTKGRGIRDQIANILWIIEKAREFQKNQRLKDTKKMWQVHVRTHTGLNPGSWSDKMLANYKGVYWNFIDIFSISVLIFWFWSFYWVWMSLLLGGIVKYLWISGHQVCN